MKQLILVLTLALGVSGCVRAPISKVPTAPTVGFGGADAGFGGTVQPANKLDARMMLSYPACTPVGGVQCTSPYGLYLPPHGYPNWDGPLNYNAQAINDAIAAAAGGRPASPAYTVQFANSSAAAFQADSTFTFNPTTHNLTSPLVNNIVFANPSAPGTTTAGINEALDSFGAAPACGTVQMPWGSFTITGTVGGSHISGRDGCILRGHGGPFSSTGVGTYLTWAGASGGTMMDIVQCQHCKTEDFSLDGGGLAGVFHWIDTNSSMTQVNNIRIIHGNSTSIAFQMGVSSGTVPGETFYSNTFIENVSACWYIFGEGTADGRTGGSNVCVPTQYGVHIGLHTSFLNTNTTYSSYGAVPITLFQIDAGGYGITIKNAYGEEFSNILNAPGTASTYGPNVVIKDSAFDPQISNASVGSYTGNGILTMENVQINPSGNNDTFTFAPVGPAGVIHGYMHTSGMSWGNVVLTNGGATALTGTFDSDDPPGGPTGEMSWYPRAPVQTSSALIFDFRPLELINSSLIQAGVDGVNYFDNLPTTSGPNVELKWRYNGAILGGWNMYDTPAASTWFTAYDFIMFDALKGSNGHTFIPVTAASFLGSSSGGPLLCNTAGAGAGQFCDSTGAWNTPAAAPLTGTTGSIGGGALLVNACAIGTATVTGISSAMAISVTPVSDPNASTTQDYDWYGYMSGTNTVTVKVCALVAGTPGATNYNVRAIQ